MKTTRMLTLDAEQPAAALIEGAAVVLRSGGLVAFPTETVYGLGADAFNVEAVKGIFAAKERPSFDPLIVHVASLNDLERVAATVPPLALKLAAQFWPGPLTLVLPRHSNVPLAVTAGGETVAVRMPAHPVALTLIKATGRPVAAPSANRFGRLSPTRAEDVLADLDGRIDMILDGGPTAIGVESTVLSLVESPPVVLRPGGIGREALEAVLGPVMLLERPVVPSEGGGAPAPGTLLQHYAPRAALYLYQGSRRALWAALRAETLRLQGAGVPVGLLLAEEDREVLGDLAVPMAIPGAEAAVEAVAQQLFVCLRQLDQAGVQVILARDFGTVGLGLAVRDRLTRAAGGKVIILSEG